MTINDEPMSDNESNSDLLTQVDVCMEGPYCDKFPAPGDPNSLQIVIGSTCSGRNGTTSDVDPPQSRTEEKFNATTPCTTFSSFKDESTGRTDETIAVAGCLESSPSRRLIDLPVSSEEEESMMSDSSDNSIDTVDAAEVIPAISLTEKRNRNILRHRDVMDRLGLAHHGTISHRRHPSSNPAVTSQRRTTHVHHHDDDIGQSDCRHLTRGMLLFSGGTSRHRDAIRTLSSSSSSSSTSPIAASEHGNQRYLSFTTLCEAYPFRHDLIRKLRDVLSLPLISLHHSPLGYNNPGHAMVDTSPPPIFITGPVGCGKTAIVQDVLQHVIQDADNAMRACSSLEISQQCTALTTVSAARAYIDCRTLDIPSLEEFVSDIYGQFAPQFNTPKSTSKANPRTPTTGPSPLSSESASADPTRTDPHRTTLSTEGAASEAKTVVQRRTSMRTKGTSQPPPRGLQNRGHTLATSNQARPAAMPHKTATSLQQPDQRGISAPSMAIWRLGIALERWLHRSSGGGPKAAFLVIDNAEQLLSLAGSSRYKTTGASDHVNFLVQLLLLPRTLPLNLTIIIITKSILLEHCALNAVSARGSLKASINPLRMHFPAYQGKQTIQTILGTKAVQRLIVGEGWDESEFQQVVVKSFIATLVPFLYDLTRDIKEYTRIGRALWPIYVQPVLPENIDVTLHKLTPHTNDKSERMAKTEIQREILSMLDQRIFPFARQALDHGVATIEFESPPSEVGSTRNNDSESSCDMPHLVKFLLLAVYVCQVNRPDKDKALFSIQSNGKRKRREHNETGEDVAFGALTIRPRTFPLERLYSLYVSMISLNPTDEETGENVDERLRSLGNVSFHDTIAYFQDIGILHDYPKRMAADPIRISQRSFWSSLTREEAQAIAKSVGFPLERYVL